MCLCKNRKKEVFKIHQKSDAYSKRQSPEVYTCSKLEVKTLKQCLHAFTVVTVDYS